MRSACLVLFWLAGCVAPEPLADAPAGLDAGADTGSDTPPDDASVVDALSDGAASADAPDAPADAGLPRGDPILLVEAEADTSCPDWAPMAPVPPPDDIPAAGAEQLFVTTFTGQHVGQALLADGSLVLVTHDERVRRVGVDGTVLWERSIARRGARHYGTLHVTPEGTILVERTLPGGAASAATVLRADGSLGPDLTLPPGEPHYAQILVGDHGRIYLSPESGVILETCRGGRLLRVLRAVDAVTGRTRPLFGLVLDQRGDLFASAAFSPRVSRFRYTPDGTVETALLGEPPESYWYLAELPTGGVFSAHEGRTLIGVGGGFEGCASTAVFEPDDRRTAAPDCATLFDGLGRIVAVHSRYLTRIAEWRCYDGSSVAYDAVWPDDLSATFTTDGGFLWLPFDGSRIEAVGPAGAPVWSAAVSPARPGALRFLELTDTHRAWHVESVGEPDEGIRVRHFAISSSPASSLRWR